MDPLKDYFESSSLPGGADACPSEEKLSDWAEGRLGDADREKMVEHAAVCEGCTRKAALIKTLQRERHADVAPPRTLDAKIAAMLRRKARGEAANAPHTAVWMALFALFMGLSFVWTKYFLQMLVMAVVFAGKWLIESRARRIFIDVTHRGAQTPQDERGPHGERARGIRTEDKDDRS